MKKPKLVSLSEILKKIAEKKKDGKNEKWFFNSHLTKLDADKLEDDGYKISANYVRGIPNFKVSW